MPVYNGERLLERSLGALVGQSFQDFELIISDNASTDATAEICQRYAREDQRIRYVRQPANIGAVANFLFVLDQAQAPYYMWAAHDDVWAPTFISANHDVLAKRQDVVLSVSQAEFVNDAGEVVDTGSTGTEALLGSPRSNVRHYLKDPGQNSRFYGLHRTAVIRQCVTRGRPVWADDWLIMARTLKFGKHYETSECLFRRSPDGSSSQAEVMIAKMYPSALFRALPMLPFTWAVLTDPLVPKSCGACWHLLNWNKRYFRHWLRAHRHPPNSMADRMQRLDGKLRRLSRKLQRLVGIRESL
jgi:glycosyltransferase involved in cell wall biosynthesis